MSTNTNTNTQQQTTTSNGTMATGLATEHKVAPVVTEEIPVVDPAAPSPEETVAVVTAKELEMLTGNAAHAAPNEAQNPDGEPQRGASLGKRRRWYSDWFSKLVAWLRR